MKRKTPGRIVRTVADALWKRDQMQMRAMDTLLSVMPPARRRPAKAPRTRKPKSLR